MRVLLINPPKENEIFGNNPKLIEKVRGYSPPLGLLYIAGYLLEHSDYEVDIIDAQVERLGYPELEARIAEKQADVIGITSMTLTLLDVIETIKTAKLVWPDSIIVLGGPHASIYPAETAKLYGVDFVVIGEGEETTLELINAIDKNNSVENVLGICFMKDGRRYLSPPRPLLDDLDSLPIPPRILIPYQSYFSILFNRSPVTSIFTSRGCPYRCTFCDRPHLGKIFRCRSAENVVKEIQGCVSLGIRDFLFYDDTFTVDKERVHRICDLIVENSLDVTWDVRAHVNTINNRLLVKMKEAGCQAIHYGVESGNDRILKSIKKGITKDKVREVFKMTKGAGLKCLAYFIIGFPDETMAEIEDTYNFAVELDPDYLHLTKLCPFPSTQIYLDGLSSGFFSDDIWREFSENPNSDFTPPSWEQIFNDDELNELIKKGYKRFYLRKSYIIRQLLNIGSIGDLKRKINAGLEVINM